MPSFSPHPFTQRQAQYFLAVAQTLSFRKAAELCHVSQPSLSAQLSQLEEVLGVQLFERDTRRTLLTHAGEALLPRAQAMVLSADDLLAAARTFADPLSGQLKVGVIPTVSPYLLPHLAPALREEFPKLSLYWIEEKTGALIPQLEAGALDAAVLALDEGTDAFEYEELADDDFLLAVPQGHPLSKATTPVSEKVLRDEKMLLLDDGHCLRSQVLEVCTRAKATELEFRATSIATLVQMVAAGNGVTLLPRLAAGPEMQTARLVVRPISKPVPLRKLVLAWRKNAPIRKALKQVAGAMRAHWPS